MELQLTPAQYSNLKLAAASTPGLQLTMTAPNSGTLVTSDVSLAWIYDGIQALSVTITARRSLKARLASEAAIDSKVAEVLMQYAQ